MWISGHDHECRPKQMYVCLNREPPDINQQISEVHSVGPLDVNTWINSRHCIDPSKQFKVSSWTHLMYVQLATLNCFVICDDLVDGEYSQILY